MTSKIPVAPGLLKEEQLTFQRKIQALIKWHDIPKDLVLKRRSNPFVLHYCGKQYSRI